MEQTPDRVQAGSFLIAADEHSSPRRSTRIKKPPPITPRRFTRFFTPRLKDSQHGVETSRAALRNISGTALNIRQNQGSSVDVSRPVKRRKISTVSPSSSLPSSPVRRVGFLPSSQELEDVGSISEASTDIEDEEEDGPERESGSHLQPRTIPFRNLSASAGLLSSRISGRKTLVEAADSALWQHETAHFASSSTDLNGDFGPQTTVMALPFCATSCNTNPLTAIGDEDGCVRIIDSANETSKTFGRTYLIMKPHDNAVMDLQFSNDDKYLASAGGDQSCHVIDMQSQTSLWCLSGHTSSIKRVQFQPGSNNNVLATCARDGHVNLWDLRCSSQDRPAVYIRRAVRQDMTRSTRYVAPINTIRDAHTGRVKKSEVRTRSAAVPGRNDFTVTSLSFLNETRPHLLVTASENDAVVKLWDMRTTYGSRRGRPTPMSCTTEPKSHELHRRFGITSLSMNTDGSKLYTLCRDHTIYAYSTSHLILGSSPEMSQTSTKAFRPDENSRQGLGPLYGFRHPSLRVSTFYPKLAIRRSTDNNTELIAVGSSDDCAVLFPTHERYLIKSNQIIPAHSATAQSQFANGSRPPRLTRVDSQTIGLHLARRQDDDIPIYYHGTPLIRGHNKEVTAVTWTSEGNLLTTSDDYITRCWREDRDLAKTLRQAPDGEGGRWMAGWAAVAGRGFDDEDE